MGRSKKGILGGFTGTIGTVVGTKWRGEYIMRSLPDHGDMEPTPGQLEQQARFTKVIKFLTQMKAVVGVFFGKAKGTRSIFNLASSYHMKYALIEVAGEPAIDYPKVVISKGDLQGIMDGEMEAAAGQVVAVRWINNSGAGFANATDELLVVVYCEALNLCWPIVGGATRADETYELTLPAFLTGIEVHGWAGFATADGEEASTSMYLGTVVVT